MADDSLSTPSGCGKATAFNPPKVLERYLSKSVWSEFTPLAAEHKAVNLGQGFPGWAPPAFVTEAGAKAINAPAELFMNNQYGRPAGRVELVQRLAKQASAKLGRDVDAMSQVCVSNGATQALFNAMAGLLNPGDEMLTLEPTFDPYRPQAEMQGATMRVVPLHVREGEGGCSSEWVLDMAELRAGFNDKTRVFLLNTPHNPTGKVFTRAELTEIAAILEEFPRVVVVTDEVYEHLCFEGHALVPFASLPGMWDRTVTISSAGKTFSVTGWKIGWTIGPAHLIKAISIASQWVVFCVNTPCQLALAEVLDRAEQPYEGHASYYAWLLSEYSRKRKLLADALVAAGITPLLPEGSFFIVGDTSKLKVPDKYLADKGVTRDWALCRWLTVEIGVTAIPPSAFYGEENKEMAANYARFAFCKSDAELREAGRRLLAVRKHLRA